MNGYPLSQYKDYLHDESRLIGTAEKIHFPREESQIQEICRSLSSTSTPLTVQGARTGIVGGAVPERGEIINLNRMDNILGIRYDAGTKQFYLRVQPGLNLQDLRQKIKDLSFDLQNWDEQSLYTFDQMKDKTALFFPPDPTETTASLGGMAATNASGALSYYYGSVRNHIQSLKIVLMDGDILQLEKKEKLANRRYFEIQTLSGKTIEGHLPAYNLPNTKNTAGYHVKDNLDMMDLFIGAEGTLGIISEMEIILREKPEEIWGLIIFWERESQSLAFVNRINQMDSMGMRGPQAVEFFDDNSLKLLQAQKKKSGAFNYLPDFPDPCEAAVYLEFHGPDKTIIEHTFESICEFIEQIGGSLDKTWLADNHHELDRMKQFRHAIPEVVNLTIDEKRKSDENITKLGTDMAVPDKHLKDAHDLYQQRLTAASLEYVIFGHIGNNHLHVNILPNNEEEYNKGKNEYLNIAKEVVAWGGTVAAEHGIGKIKKQFLKLMYGDKSVQEMKDLKKLFDPKGLLNQGNLF